MQRCSDALEDTFAPVSSTQSGSYSDGDGSASMQKFVQAHLASILQPIAEHVDELQKKTDKIVRDLSLASGKIEKSNDRLDRLDQELGATGSDVAKNRSELLEVRTDLMTGDYSKKIAALEAHAPLWRDTCCKLDARIDAAGASLQGLRMSLEESSAGLHKVELKLWQTTNLAQRVETSLQDLREEHGGLAERHHGLTRSVQQTQQAVETTRAFVAKFPGSLEAASIESTKRFAALGQRAELQEQALRETENALHAQEDLIASRSGDVKKLMKQMDQVQEEIRLTKVAAARGSSLSVPERLADLETRLAELARNMTEEFDKRIASVSADLLPRITKCSNESQQTAAGLRNQNTNLRKQEERIINTERHLAEAQRKIESALDATGSQETKIKRLSDSHQDLDGRLDYQRSELEAVHNLHSGVAKEVESLQLSMQLQATDLGLTMEGVAKIAAHLDLAHDYLHGLKTGLLETTRKVVQGQDGMLPPRAQGKVLPTLTASANARPRPISASLPRASHRASLYAENGRPTSPTT